jgi:GTPase SAR1 family protein
MWRAWWPGADFALKIIRCEDGNVIRLQLWDIAGQERFGNMTRVYFKGAVGAIVVHDINKKGENCFDAPKRWKKELDEHVGVAGKAADGKGVPTVLLANKVRGIKW